jgi:hypothetical protein
VRGTCGLKRTKDCLLRSPSTSIVEFTWESENWRRGYTGSSNGEKALFGLERNLLDSHISGVRCQELIAGRVILVLWNTRWLDYEWERYPAVNEITSNTTTVLGHYWIATTHMSLITP